MAARNLAISLLPDITPAGCSQHRREGSWSRLQDQAAGSACSEHSPAEALTRATHAHTDPVPTQDGLGGTVLREAAGHRNGREGIPHVRSAVPSQCWRVTGPSGSQRSAGDLQLHLVAPWPGLLRLQREGAGEGKS